MNMEARRRGMMADEPGETWDYVLYPANGEEVGQFACKLIPVTAGCTVEIEYMSFYPNASPYVYSSSGYVYDARGECGGVVTGDNYLFAAKNTAGQKQTVVIRPKRSGKLSVACVNGKADGFIDSNIRDLFYGYYIKVRVT